MEYWAVNKSYVPLKALFYQSLLKPRYWVKAFS